MRFDNIIRDLQAAGLSERAIGAGAGVSQSSIRNMRDHGGRPKWETGQALIALHTITVGQKSRRQLARMAAKRKVKVA